MIIPRSRVQVQTKREKKGKMDFHNQLTANDHYIYKGETIIIKPMQITLLILLVAFQQQAVYAVFVPT
jgi:hypothetical protein